MMPLASKNSHQEFVTLSAIAVTMYLLCHDFQARRIVLAEPDEKCWKTDTPWQQPQENGAAPEPEGVATGAAPRAGQRMTRTVGREREAPVELAVAKPASPVTWNVTRSPVAVTTSTLWSTFSPDSSAGYTSKTSPSRKS